MSHRENVEALLELLDRLMSERQDLRAASVPAATLEENRLAIVRAQWDLSYALIDRYQPVPRAA